MTYKKVADNKWNSDDLNTDENLLNFIKFKVENKEVNKIGKDILNNGTPSEETINKRVKEIETKQKDLSEKHNWTTTILLIVYITLAIAMIGWITDFIQYRRGKTNDLENKIDRLESEIQSIKYNIEFNQKSQKLYIDNAVKDNYIRILEKKPI